MLSSLTVEQTILAVRCARQRAWTGGRTRLASRWSTSEMGIWIPMHYASDVHEKE